MQAKTWQKAGLIALVVVGAAPAAAQTTTDCRAIGATVNCRTQPDSWAVLGGMFAARAQKKRDIELFAQAVREGRCDDARALAVHYHDADAMTVVQNQCVTPEAAAAQKQATLLASITASVKAGHCTEAKGAALDAGRLDLADQVVRVCTPSSP